MHENKTVDKALYRELNLLGYYLDQYDAFDQYVSFTENLKTRAEQMKLSPLWGDANSFSYRNIQKTAADYEKLDEQLQVGINEGVMFLGNAFWTDWLLLLFAIYIGFMLFKWEHENNALNLVSSCVRGRGMLGIAKVVTALSLEIGAFMFLYGSNYAIAARLYGFGGLDRAIQSVSKLWHFAYSRNIYCAAWSGKGTCTYGCFAWHLGRHFSGQRNYWASVRYYCHFVGRISFIYVDYVIVKMALASLPEFLLLSGWL